MEFWRGYPMSDVKVIVFDGDYHDVDFGRKMAFKICASICVKEAARKAKACCCWSR